MSVSDVNLRGGHVLRLNDWQQRIHVRAPALGPVRTDLHGASFLVGMQLRHKHIQSTLHTLPAIFSVKHALAATWRALITISGNSRKRGVPTAGVKMWR